MNLSIETLHRLCRLCLLEEGLMLSLYELPLRGQQSLPERIMKCADIQVKKGDGLPGRICYRCRYLLDRCVEFRQQCEESDVKMRELLASVAVQDLVLPIKSEISDDDVITNSVAPAAPSCVKSENLQIVYHRSRVSWIAKTPPDSAPIIQSIIVPDSESDVPDSDTHSITVPDSDIRSITVPDSETLNISVLDSETQKMSIPDTESYRMSVPDSEPQCISVPDTESYKITVPDPDPNSNEDGDVIEKPPTAGDLPQVVEVPKKEPIVRLQRLDEAVIKMYADKRNEKEMKRKKYLKIYVFSDTGSDVDEVIPMPVRKRGRPKIMPVRSNRWSKGSHGGSSRASSIIESVVGSTSGGTSVRNNTGRRGSHGGSSRASSIMDDIVDTVAGSTSNEPAVRSKGRKRKSCSSVIDDVIESVVGSSRAESTEISQATSKSVGEMNKDGGKHEAISKSVGNISKNGDEATVELQDKWDEDVSEYFRLEKEKVMKKMEIEGIVNSGRKIRRESSRVPDRDDEVFKDDEEFTESFPEVINIPTLDSDEDVDEADDENYKTEDEVPLASFQTCVLADKQNVSPQSSQCGPAEVAAVVPTCSLTPETNLTTTTQVSSAGDSPEKLYEAGQKPPEVVAIIEEWTADIASRTKEIQRAQGSKGVENAQNTKENSGETAKMVQNQNECCVESTKVVQIQNNGCIELAITEQGQNNCSVETVKSVQSTTTEKLLENSNTAESLKDVPTMYPECTEIKKEFRENVGNEVQEVLIKLKVQPVDNNADCFNPPSKPSNQTGKVAQKDAALNICRAPAVSESDHSRSEGKRNRHGSSGDAVEIGSVMSLGDCETVINNMPYILDEYHISDEYHVTDEPAPSIVQEHYDKRIDDWVTGTTITNPDIRDKYHSNSSFIAGSRIASICSDIVVVKEVGGGSARTMPLNMVYYATRHTRTMPEWTRREREWFWSRIQQEELRRLRAVRFERRSPTVYSSKSQPIVSQSILIPKATNNGARVNSAMVWKKKVTLNSKSAQNAIVNDKSAVNNGSCNISELPNEIVANDKAATHVNDKIPLVPIVNNDQAATSHVIPLVPIVIHDNAATSNINDQIHLVPIVNNDKAATSYVNDKIPLVTIVNNDKAATSYVNDNIPLVPIVNNDKAATSYVNDKIPFVPNVDVVLKEKMVEKSQHTLTEIPAKSVPPMYGKVLYQALTDSSAAKKTIVNTAKILPRSNSADMLHNRNKGVVAHHNEIVQHTPLNGVIVKPNSGQNISSLTLNKETNHLSNNNGDIPQTQNSVESDVATVARNSIAQDIPSKDTPNICSPVASVIVSRIVEPHQKKLNGQTKVIQMTQSSIESVLVEDTHVECLLPLSQPVQRTSVDTATNTVSTVTNSQVIIKEINTDKAREVMDVGEILKDDEDDETLENIRKHILSTQSVTSPAIKRGYEQEVGGERAAKTPRLEAAQRKRSQELPETKETVDQLASKTPGSVRSNVQSSVEREKDKSNVGQTQTKNTVPIAGKSTADSSVSDREMVRMAQRQIEELDKPPVKKQPEVTPLVTFVLRGPMENQNAPKKVIDSKMAAAVKRFLNRGIPHSEYTEQLLLKRFATPRAEVKKTDVVVVDSQVEGVNKKQKVDEKQDKICLNVEMPSRNGFYLEPVSKQRDAQQTCVFRNGFAPGGDTVKPEHNAHHYSLRRISEEAARHAETVKTFTATACQTHWKPSLLPVLLESSHVEIVKNQNAADERAARDLQKPAVLKKIYEKAARSLSAAAHCSENEKQTQTAWLSEWRAPTSNAQLDNYVIPKKTVDPAQSTAAKRIIEEANHTKQIRRKESWVFMAKKDNFDEGIVQAESRSHGRVESVIKLTDGSQKAAWKPPPKRAKSLETIVQTLKKQRRKPEPRERTIPCPVCAKLFAMKCHLRKHMRVHSDERPYACHLCAWSFKTKQTLRMHVGCVHENIRYVCDECGMEFESKLRLSTHYRLVHLGERVNQCKRCGKNYLRPKNLAAHMAKRHRT